MKKFKILDSRENKMIGAIDEHNRIAPVMLLEDYENNHVKGCKVSDKYYFKHFNAIEHLSFDDSIVSESDKNTLYSLPSGEVILCDVTTNVIEECNGSKKGNKNTELKVMKICNIQKYDKPNALETLINRAQSRLYEYQLKPNIQGFANQFPDYLDLNILKCCYRDTASIFVASLLLKDQPYFNADDIHELLGGDIENIKKGLNNLEELGIIERNFMGKNFILPPYYFNSFNLKEEKQISMHVKLIGIFKSNDYSDTNKDSCTYEFESALTKDDYDNGIVKGVFCGGEPYYYCKVDVSCCCYISNYLLTEKQQEFMNSLSAGDVIVFDAYYQIHKYTDSINFPILSKISNLEKYNDRNAADKIRLIASTAQEHQDIKYDNMDIVKENLKNRR